MKKIHLALLFSLISAPVLAQTTPETRSAAQSYINAFINTNGNQAISGADVNSALNQIVSSSGFVGDTNTWTGINNFTGTFQINGVPLGTGVAAGLGSAVNASGGFVTYNGTLGTPTSGNLANTTGLPLSTGVSGVLSSANGGLGAASLSGILQGNGSSAATAITPGTGVASALTQAVTGSGSIVLSASPTFTGTPAAPTATTGTNTTQLATTAFVNSSISGVLNPPEFRNRIINGAMDIDQRNSGASGTVVNGFTVDRWVYPTTQNSKGTWGQNLNSVTPPLGFQHYLGFQSSSSYSLVSTDFFGLFQPIEANNFPDIAFGTANAQSITLSFRVYSSLTGSFGGSIRNYAVNRSYPFIYSIPTANTWTTISVTIPGDTAGTWVNSGTAGMMYVNFGLGAGSSFENTAGSWYSGNYFQPISTVCVVCTTGATFYVTGVQLEVGTVATTFERRLYPVEVSLAQRYFVYETNLFFQVYVPSANTYAYSTYTLPAVMRVNPTIAVTAYTNIGVATGAPLAGVLNSRSFYPYGSSSAAGTMEITGFAYTASAEL